MNILYIGPYRLNHHIGYESLNILLDLHDHFPNIVARPIYCQLPVNKLDDIDLLLKKIENNSINNFDIIIQHTTLNGIVFNTKAKRHIFLPILQNTACDHTQKQIAGTLQNYGVFLTYRDTDDFILNHAGIKNKLQFRPLIHNRLSGQVVDSFNLGIYNTYKKYYTISEAHNENSLKELIINFITNINNLNSCLVLFLHNTNQQILDKYNALIKNIYNTMDINYSISKVIIVPVQLNNQVISTIHGCCDIYIDMNNDIHAYYAAKYHKPILLNDSEINLRYDHTNIQKLPSAKYINPINLSNIKSITRHNHKLLKDIISSNV